MGTARRSAGLPYRVPLQPPFIFRKKAYNNAMNGTIRQILGGLLVCALLIAAAIPAGFMPNIARAQTPEGKLYPLVLCTAYGEKTVFVPAGQTPETPASDDTPAHAPDDHAACPYAPVFAHGLPAAAAPAALVLYAAAPGQPRDDTRAATVARKHWQAQAPPLC